MRKSLEKIAACIVSCEAYKTNNLKSFKTKHLDLASHSLFKNATFFQRNLILFTRENREINRDIYFAITNNISNE